MDFGKNYSMKGKKTKPLTKNGLPSDVVCIHCGEKVIDKPYHYIQTKRGSTHFIHEECVQEIKGGDMDAAVQRLC